MDASLQFFDAGPFDFQLLDASVKFLELSSKSAQLQLPGPSMFDFRLIGVRLVSPDARLPDLQPIDASLQSFDACLFDF